MIQDARLRRWAPGAALIALGLALAWPSTGLGAPPAPRPAAKPAPRPAPRPAWKPRNTWRPPVRSGYREAVARWHAPTPGKSAPVDASGRPMLVLMALNIGERVELPAASDDGGFDAASLDRAARLLRDPRAGLSHPVEPAVLDLVYRAQRRFDAEEIRVISGYRAPGAKGASNHGRGRAIDLVIPGAKDTDVVQWARQVGFTGVGLYPVGGFCHLDVRPQSYFWVDSSGPGQRNREAPVLGSQAQKSDEEARRAHRKPIGPHLLPSSSLEGTWRSMSEGGPLPGGADPPMDDHDADDDSD